MYVCRVCWLHGTLRSAKDVESPGAWVIHGCKPPCSLPVQQGLKIPLAAEPCVQPQSLAFKKESALEYLFLTLLHPSLLPLSFASLCFETESLLARLTFISEASCLYLLRLENGVSHIPTCPAFSTGSRLSQKMKMTSKL